MVAVAIHTTAGHIYKEGCQVVAISLGLREPTLIQVLRKNPDLAIANNTTLTSQTSQQNSRLFVSRAFPSGRKHNSLILNNA